MTHFLRKNLQTFLKLGFFWIILTSCSTSVAVTDTLDQHETMISPTITIPSNIIPTSTQLVPSPTLKQIPTQTSIPSQLPSPTNTLISIPSVVHDDWTSITNANYIRAILVDHNGDLWTGGSGGVVHWNVRDHTYIKYTSEHGLAGNFVTSIGEGLDNTLWFGTYKNGISRFDGQSWVTYTKDDGLISDWVLSVAVGPDGVIWVGTLEGLSFFDGESWTSLEPEKIQGDPILRADTLAVTQDGVVWVGGHWGHYYESNLYGLKKFDGQISQDMSDEFGSNIVTGLAIAPDQTIWVGTTWGVAHFDGKSWERFELSNVDGLTVSSIAVSPDGSVWVSFSILEQPLATREDSGDRREVDIQGVWRFDGQDWSLVGEKDGLVENEIRAITSSPEGDVWFGSYNHGVSLYDGIQWVTFQTNDSLPDNNVEHVAVTQSGQLWVGYPNTIAQYDGQQWQTYTEINGHRFRLLGENFIDSDQRIWFGTLNGEVIRFDTQGWTFFSQDQFEQLNAVYAISELPNGDFILGGPGGSGIFNGKSWRIIHQLDEVDVFDIQILPDGTQWYATSEGIYSFDGKHWEDYTTLDGLLSDFIRDIVFTPDGQLWAGNCNEITRFDGKKWKTFINLELYEFGQLAQCVRDMAVDSNGILWVSTAKGLVRIEGEKWETYTAQDGMAATDIRDIYIDTNGVVWIASYAGISRYIPPLP